MTHDGAGKPSSLAEERIAEVRQHAELCQQYGRYTEETQRGETTLAIIAERAEMLRLLRIASCAYAMNDDQLHHMVDTLNAFLSTRSPAGKDTR